MAHGRLARVEKKARLERRTRVFIDEAGFYLLPALVRTYAPSGQMPILKVRQTYDHLSVMSGVTLTGQLSTLVRTEALTGIVRGQFLKQRQRYLGPRLLAIWDGSPIHRGEEVKSFLADGGAPAIHLEQLPPYAPDLNPDEGMGDLLKTVEMRNLCCLDFNHLYRELYLAIRRLRRQPSLLQACFVGAGFALE
jgi:transposase